MVAHLSGFALRIELPVAHVAAAAGDLERDDNAVADLEVTSFIADLAHDSHGFMPEDVARFHERTEHFVQM